MRSAGGRRSRSARRGRDVALPASAAIRGSRAAKRSCHARSDRRSARSSVSGSRSSRSRGPRNSSGAGARPRRGSRRLAGEVALGSVPGRRSAPRRRTPSRSPVARGTASRRNGGHDGVAGRTSRIAPREGDQCPTGHARRRLVMPKTRSVLSRRGGADAGPFAATRQVVGGRSSGSVSPTRLRRKSSAGRASRMTRGVSLRPGDSSRTRAPGRRMAWTAARGSCHRGLSISRVLDNI